MSATVPGQHVIAIIGCGQMGSALAEAFAARSFTLRLASRGGVSAARLAARIPRATAGTVEWAAATSDVIVFAAPVEAICQQISPRIRPFAAGRVIMDVTNPGFGDDTVAPRPSAAERIAAGLPASRVVKALNCVAARVIGSARDGAVVTVPIAGDDPAAKELISSLLGQLGFETADAGPLPSSRWIEGLTELLACFSKQENLHGGIGFRLVRFPVPDAWEGQQASRAVTGW